MKKTAFIIVFTLLASFRLYSQNTSGTKIANMQASVDVVDTGSLNSQNAAFKMTNANSSSVAPAHSLAANVSASFMGDQKKFIQENLVYPSHAYQARIEGNVVVTCEVNDIGKLHSCKVKKTVHPELDAEAIRVVKLMPNWSTAKVDGFVVTGTWVDVDIPFELEVE